jgi:hypothetical protein
VAALVDNNPDGQVLAYHCCRADTPATLEPARFVRSLAGLLAARLEGYDFGTGAEEKVRETKADTSPSLSLPIKVWQFRNFLSMNTENSKKRGAA